MQSKFKSKVWIWVTAALILVILGVLAFIFLPGRGTLPSQVAPDYWPTDGWLSSTPEEQGIDSSQLARTVQSIQEKHIAIDSLTIIRNGYVILDAYYSPYDGSFPHDFASVTKSVMTTLIGIAVDQGKLQLDQKVVSFFSDRTIANLDQRKKNMTVRDLVSMRNGMESGCFKGDEPTLDAMRTTPDWIQAALDRKMAYDPGTHFCYDSPGMHLLSAILQTATGMTALEFAQQNLFEPLGIHNLVWVADPQGYTRGWGELHIEPTDAAKLGYLWLHNGNWDGRQIISASWVSESVQAHSRMVGNEYGYGYGWWVSPVDFYAMGRGGQYIRVMPSQNMVAVITSGGADFNQVLLDLLKMLLTSREKLPANTTGQAELAAAVSSISKGADIHPSSTPSDLAQVISGQSYTCDSNQVGVTSMRLDFNTPEVAALALRMNGQDLYWPIGLDGIYRLAADGQAQSGYWENENTFILNIFDVGQLTRSLHFDGKAMEVKLYESGLILKCQAQ
jgi:CubicO group peptidase (beta-lactamase class C family)